MIVSDNGAELASNAVLKWVQDHGLQWHYIAPGRPMQKGFVEGFSGPIAQTAPHGVTSAEALLTAG